MLVVVNMFNLKFPGWKEGMTKQESQPFCLLLCYLQALDRHTNHLTSVEGHFKPLLLGVLALFENLQHHLVSKS